MRRRVRVITAFALDMDACICWAMMGGAAKSASRNRTVSAGVFGRRGGVTYGLVGGASRKSQE